MQKSILEKSLIPQVHRVTGVSIGPPLLQVPGSVTISGAGNAVNGLGSTSNDVWNSYSIQIPEATSQNSPPTASNLQINLLYLPF